ncbi:MAG: YqeG family HAD IIIA-type phosphatase [Christensenellales bacterium]
MNRRRAVAHYLMPDEILKTIYDLDMERLWARGCRHILLDLDNTLVPWNAMEVPDCLLSWTGSLAERGFKCVLVSNNSDGRTNTVAKRLDLPYLANAGKPGKKAAIRAMEIINGCPKSSAIVGDQLMTDIWMGKKAGLYTVLVSPISNTEFKGTKLNRIIERALLSSMGVERP